jgi:N-acetylglucosamine-6-phosphate deacetylase
MSTTYLASSLFNGQQFESNMLVRCDKGKISAIEAYTDQPFDERLNGLLVPGFIDVQVNGGGGVLLNNEPSFGTIKTMLTAHSQFGTTAMLPTLISDHILLMQRAADAVAEAISQQHPGIIGIHFEGPHLSQPKKGIHRADYIRPITDGELTQFCRQDLGKVVVTLAPENVSPDIIKQLVGAGVKVCLGHSNADSDTVFAALAAGATGFTHLFNAMSPLTSREPGMVGAALLDEQSYCGLIVDHHHVHPQCCKLAVKTKGANRIMLVTDAMAHVGSEQDTLNYFDTVITRNGDKLTVPDGTLAGSALDMASAVRNTHRDLGVTLIDALRMASASPAEFLGLQNHLGKLATGYQADLVLLDDKQQVLASWIAGNKVFDKQPLTTT